MVTLRFSCGYSSGVDPRWYGQFETKEMKANPRHIAAHIYLKEPKAFMIMLVQ
jgi:hypothetical protein